jgi:hypothetical protein
MYAEIHRHFVLFKNSSDSRHSRFRQIVVVERRQFEVRVFESDIIELDPKFTDDGSDTGVQFHSTLSPAVLNAESEYKQSVRNGWRACDPTATYPPVRNGPRSSAA